jgi:hypothetical protein
MRRLAVFFFTLAAIVAWSIFFINLGSLLRSASRTGSQWARTGLAFVLALWVGRRV